jgi:hypothetical protein
MFDHHSARTAALWLIDHTNKSLSCKSLFGPQNIIHCCQICIGCGTQACIQIRTLSMYCTSMSSYNHRLHSACHQILLQLLSVSMTQSLRPQCDQCLYDCLTSSIITDNVLIHPYRGLCRQHSVLTAWYYLKFCQTFGSTDNRWWVFASIVIIPVQLGSSYETKWQGKFTEHKRKKPRQVVRG